MVSAHTWNRAALLGIATGLRSMTPLAALSWAASSGRLSLGDTFPFSLLARREISTLFLVSAAGELVADKLPFAPARTEGKPLLARVVFGALAGAAGFAAEEESIALGAVEGGVFAAWGAFAGLSVRTKLTDLGVPAILAGMTGDLLAISLAVPAVLQRGSKVR